MTITRERVAPVPDWVIGGWYANNPERMRIAMIRYHLPVTTAEEREEAHTFTIDGVTYPCQVCGKFAFSKPSTCYWCGR